MEDESNSPRYDLEELNTIVTNEERQGEREVLLVEVDHQLAAAENLAAFIELFELGRIADKGLGKVITALQGFRASA